ncbi:glutaminase A [Alkalihalobacillus sp. 1P02AB]|uniref:glutaminase A n=1 Tax=Alkalihalobacillus sp. 1P02AB TaxID=3132260 RepID=UPI0039A4B11D
MICKGQSELDEMVKQAQKSTINGKVANYIPALAKAERDVLAVSIFDGADLCFVAGNSEERFTLQSASKVITLALALIDCGEDKVFKKVGMEPTGDPFNSISKLETQIPSKPLNPMINAGALAVSSLIKGRTADEKLQYLLAFIHKLSGNNKITYNQEVAQSEFESADLNRALAYFLKQHHIIDGDVNELIDFYTKQCAIELTCNDLARIGYVLANEGRCADGQEVIPFEIARLVKTFMVTCGMYNASGEFAIKVGIPAKSGVSGCILGAVPNRLGIGIYGPALDEKGNSVAGMKLLELLAEHYRLSIF